MKDRVPKYPGRVKLVPVTGQENTFDMLRADEPTQPGDPLNKATFLTDATAAMFGLDNNAVPDDVLVSIKTMFGRQAEAIANGTKIATGSYVGTGRSAYVSVGFKPKLVIIYNSKAINADYLGCIMVPGGGFLNNGLTAAVEFTDTSFKQPSSFYDSGTTYYYTAIG